MAAQSLPVDCAAFGVATWRWPTYLARMTPVVVKVWSDVVCPWCYVGKRRLEAALRSFGEPVAIEWKAFELDPRAPTAREQIQSLPERLAAKYGRTKAQAEAMLAQMTETGAAEGLELRFDRALTANTFDAHRVIHLGGVRGLQTEVKERLFRGYFTDGELLSDHPTLVRLAAEVGLPADEVARMLASEQYAKEVRADEAEARSLGISGVPFFVIDGRVGISGAQAPDALLSALRQARTSN